MPGDDSAREIFGDGGMGIPPYLATLAAEGGNGVVCGAVQLDVRGGHLEIGSICRSAGVSQGRRGNGGGTPDGRRKPGEGMMDALQRVDKREDEDVCGRVVPTCKHISV